MMKKIIQYCLCVLLVVVSCLVFTNKPVYVVKAEERNTQKIQQSIIEELEFFIESTVSVKEKTEE